MFSGRHEAASSKIPFLKTSKNQGQKKKVRFRHIWAFFGGPRNPYFCSVSKAPKRGGSIKLSWSDAGGVQLRTRKHIYIYKETRKEEPTETRERERDRERERERKKKEKRESEKGKWKRLVRKKGRHWKMSKRNSFRAFLFPKKQKNKNR